MISAKGVARAALDTVLPPTELGDRDISVGDLVEERLGKEVVDRLVEPLLGGVYAGHAREISARAAVPQLVALLEHDRSLTRAAAAATPPPSDGRAAGLRRHPRGSGAGSPRPLAALRRHGAHRRHRPRPGAPPRRAAGTSWSARPATPRSCRPTRSCSPPRRAPPPGCSATSRPRRRSTWPASSTRRWPSSRWPFAARAFPDVAGSGFLVPPVDGRAVKASTFSFAKWDWVREAGRGRGRACCCAARWAATARSRPSSAPTRSWSSWRCADLADAVGLSVRPVDTHVQRWGGALPQYAVGHLDRVAAVRRELDALPGLAVCGSAYDGVGIPACIASAEAGRRQGRSRTLRQWSHDPGTTSDRRQEGTRAQRHDPLHDVVGVPAARRARRGRRPRRTRPARSRSWSPSSRPTTSSSAGSTTSAACAPTPT